MMAIRRWLADLIFHAGLWFFGPRMMARAMIAEGWLNEAQCEEVYRRWPELRP